MSINSPYTLASSGFENGEPASTSSSGSDTAILTQLSVRTPYGIFSQAVRLAPPQHTQSADHHPAAVYLASLAPGSRRAMHAALDTVARMLTGGQEDSFSLLWGMLRYQHTQAIRASLAEAYSPAMANKCLSALRGTLKAAWRLEQIPTEEYSRAVDVPAVKGETLPRGRALPMGELRALFIACADGTTVGARDAALLAVLYGIGLRRAEAVALQLSDYETESGALTVRSGKGNKARIGYATNGSQAALDAWLCLRGSEEGPLFMPVLKGGHIKKRQLNNQTVLDVLAKRAQQAGIKNVSPHDFRRTFISDLLDAGADIATVQKMAGHANVTTTSRYDRRGEVAKQKAAEMLHVPFAG